MEGWEFPGFGDYHRTMSVEKEELRVAEDTVRTRGGTEKLNELEATAISGNDILSSCLYVSSQVTESAGILAPVCLTIVAAILWIYKGIYGEAISAISMNGGSYNLLINTSTKPVAALAACLAVISYIATGVVSATTAVVYLQVLVPAVPLIGGIVLLHFFFAVLNAWGIGDSAKVAVFIFILHLCVLVMFVILGVVYMVFSGGGHLQENFYTHYPDASVADETVEGNTFSALYFGTCAGMLGVSGFESSSQFVESQGPGVFVKTLRNMWIGVVVFNPVISLVSLSVLPLEDVKAAHGSLLAVVADHAGNWLQDAIADMSDWVPRVSSSEYTLGQVLQFIVCVDAFIVLCGAVLTSYVGINGLACRMASDRVLPEFLLNRNRWRNTTHNTALIFFLLSALQVAILKGDVDGLSGVYSFAFLGVMIAFGVGTIMLKFKRPSLPREVTVSFAAACFGVVLVVCTFLGTLMGKSVYVSYFSFYLIGVGAVIIIMFQRVRLLRLLYVAMRSVFPNSAFANLKALISKLRSGPMLFYAKHPDLYVLNKAVLYVRDNEQSNELLIVHVTPYSATSGKAEKPLLEASSTEQVEEGADARREEIERIEAAVKMLDHMYPKLKISFMCVYGGRFNPYIVELIGEKLGIEKIRMMIACPDSVMPDKLAAFGGVRVITH